jgi:hypothetical protein
MSKQEAVSNQQPAHRKEADITTVEIIEAKSNKMFSEEQRAMVRFLRFNRSVPCAECGKRSRVKWTMLCTFKVHEFGGQLVLRESQKVHTPLAAVCGAHPIAPYFDNAQKASAGSTGGNSVGKGGRGESPEQERSG